MVKTCPVICLETGEMFNSISDAAKYYNIDAAGISKVCKGKQKTINKTRFRYIVDDKIQYLENDEKVDIHLSLHEVEVQNNSQTTKEPKTGQEKSFLFWLNQFIKDSKYENEEELDIDLERLYHRIINNY